jgi:hypothetical protein
LSDNAFERFCTGTVVSLMLNKLLHCTLLLALLAKPEASCSSLRWKRRVIGSVTLVEGCAINAACARCCFWKEVYSFLRGVIAEKNPILSDYLSRQFRQEGCRKPPEGCM